MLNIGCVYTVEDHVTIDKPLSNSMQIPFGISIIATLLKEHNHNVNLFVLCPDTPLEKVLGNYIRKHRPKLFCLTAVSSQFHFVEKIARVVKELDPDIFVILGGYHASLAPDDAIQSPYLDAICRSEGDIAVVELASQIEAREEKISSIPNLWIKDRTNGSIEKNDIGSFNQQLDDLPYIDRTLWEPWIDNPQDEVSVLVGRGCPFRCTYCSNHAMQNLAKGKYVRYRSSENLIGEIEYVCRQYPRLRNIYLEVETIGASIVKALDLFEALAEYNSNRQEKLVFRMNLAVHSNFMKKEEKVLQFFEYCRKANVLGLNIGLESGSERVRKEILRRPVYTNEELIKFSSLAKDYGIDITLFALMGLPGETPKDFLDTVKVARKIQPKTIYLSIFYPYIGTDLYHLTMQQGLIPKAGLNPTGERRKATLDLPTFSKNRIRFEYILFWYRVYRGKWPFSKILANMLKAYITPHQRLQNIFLYITSHNKFFANLKSKVQRQSLKPLTQQS